MKKNILLTEKNKTVLRLGVWLVLFCLFMTACPVANAEQSDYTEDELSIAAEHLDTATDVSYALYDTEKGQLLLSKDSGVAVDGGMLSRMMTCLIALENHTLTEKITADKTSVSSDGNFTITKGRTYTIDTLVNTALIGNADNAARLLAANTSVTADTAVGDPFIAYMNERALKFGMNNTFFTNNDGTPAELQKTTAYDTLIFLKQALQNSRFKNVYCSPVAVSWDGIIMNNPNNTVMENTTSTLGGSFYVYDNETKNGALTYYIQNTETDAKDQRRLLLAIYGVTEDNYALSQKALLEKFNKEWRKVLYRKKGDVVSIMSLGSQSLYLVTSNDICFYAPTDSEDFMENVSYSYAAGYSPDVIKAPVYSNTPICAVRYQLKDKTTFDITLFSQNTVISERSSVNRTIAVMQKYPEIFLLSFCLFLGAMIFAANKIYWHFTLKK